MHRVLNKERKTDAKQVPEKIINKITDGMY